MMKEDKAENLADAFLNGEIECESCPDLTNLVNEVRSGRLSKEDFAEIIQRQLQHLDKVI